MGKPVQGRPRMVFAACALCVALGCASDGGAGSGEGAQPGSTTPGVPGAGNPGTAPGGAPGAVPPPATPLPGAADGGSSTTGGSAGDEASSGDGDTPTGGSVSTVETALDLDGIIVTCVDAAPPASFEPDLQWAWDGIGGRTNSYVTPLVANLTDDNGDGEIDLNDIPDVIVVIVDGTVNASIAVLDGATGAFHYEMQGGVRNDVTPALGDIDGDGLPEIVTVRRESNWRVGTLVAFEHDGTFKWQGDAVTGVDPVHIDMWDVAMADVDNDGDVEIAVGNMLFDHEGTRLWTAPTPAPNWSSTLLADLDGDMDMEVVIGHAAYHHDGSEYYLRTDVTPGFPQVADMDDDGLPEIVITSTAGLSMLEHDGTPVYNARQPMLPDGAGGPWFRPATIHDFVGDAGPEFASSQASWYSVFRPDGTAVWSAPVADLSGLATGTAFDFLGDGSAEAMYADEHNLFIFDASGQVVYQTVRSSTTALEYPVVADVDNDGSAEIIVVSNEAPNQPRSPTVQVFRDKQERWIQARRIWNQHTYHVTNVYEDGRIPRVERPHWKALNTFRTNAQIEGGELCAPDRPD